MPRTTNLRPIPLALGVLGLAGSLACAHSTTHHTTHSATTESDGRIELVLSSDDEYDIEVSVAADVGAEVHYEFQGGQVEHPLFGSNFGLDVGGAPLELGGYEFRLGDRNFGHFGSNARIEVRADGVFIDGDKRGEL